MRVLVQMIIETPDFGEPEFKREIEKLIADIDPLQTQLIDFHMAETQSDFQLGDK